MRPKRKPVAGAPQWKYDGVADWRGPAVLPVHTFKTRPVRPFVPPAAPVFLGDSKWRKLPPGVAVTQ